MSTPRLDEVDAETLKAMLNALCVCGAPRKDHAGLEGPCIAEDDSGPGSLTRFCFRYRPVPPPARE